MGSTGVDRCVQKVNSLHFAGVMFVAIEHF
jgi:hypothetical protein